MIDLPRHLYTSVLDYETRLWLYKLRHRSNYQKLRYAIHPSSNGSFSLKAFDEYQCIFMHITKTAGTSVAKGLFNYLPYHYTAIDYRVIYGRKIFNQYFKFAFVRNPWDRLYSAYRYLMSGGWNKDDENWRNNNILKYNDFNHFIENWLNEENIMKHIHFMPQYYFVCDRKDHLLLNYLAYFETINEDFDHIASQLNIKSNLSHHNASPVGSYHDVYTQKTREIVAQVYAKDITMFGYDFNGIKQRQIIPV